MHSVHSYKDFEFPSGILRMESAEADLQLLHDLSLDKFCLLEQISTDQIISIDYKKLACLSAGINKLGEADAVIIQNYNPQQSFKTLVGISTADCLPIIIHAQDQIALVHAGWRGLALAIVQKTIKQMNLTANRKVSCRVLIGAAAKGCCYEVGEDVLTALKLDSESSKQKIDLQILAEKIFQDLLPEAKVICDNRCTICSNELHSYRRDKTKLRNLSFVIV